MDGGGLVGTEARLKGGGVGGSVAGVCKLGNGV